MDAKESSETNKGDNADNKRKRVTKWNSAEPQPISTVS